MAWHHRLLNLFHRAELSQAIDDELQFHIDERVDELQGQGLNEPEARRLANRQFGNATLHKERTREMDLSRSIESLLQDIRYAVRSLKHTPAFTIAVIATLALGIGATTAIYSMVRTIWLRPLPFTAPDRVVRIWESNRPLGLNGFSASIPNFLSWRERSTSFESLIALEGRSANLTGQGDPERVASLAVTARFFDTLGIRPIRGRPFAPDEDAPGHGRVVMLSERLWRQRYGGDPDLVGRTIPIDGENRTVIGIAPNDVGFATDLDVWEPLTLDASRENRSDHRIAVLGRLRSGINLDQAEAELNGIAVQLEHEFPDSNRDWRVRIVPVLHWVVNPETRTALLILMATVVLLLVVACINVANLQLARASSRVQEFGVRQALGAIRARLVRQLALNEDPLPTVYLPASYYIWETMIVVMRGSGEPTQLAPALRQAVAKLDPQQPVFAVRTLEDLLDDGSARPRLNTFLVGSFALLALALGVVGVSGVVSYSVIQRTPEMAVRMALGATPKGVVHAVTAAGLRICLLGLVAGLAGAFALGRAMAALLYQVRPNDPAIFGIVAGVLLSAALLASWLPARRIARIDPVVALRQE